MAVPEIHSSEYAASPVPLLLKDAAVLLSHEYLPFETGYAINSEGMHHAAVSTWMPGCSGAMIDWWFGWIHNTEQYKLWHPRDHVFSDWEGPRLNDSTYVGGHHLIHEYIGGHLAKLKISFLDPGKYFCSGWKEDFKRTGYSTAVCGRVGNWNPDTGHVFYNGHLIHLVRDEPEGCRMRSRFWLGDVDGLTDPARRAAAVPAMLGAGLTKHCAEEMAIIASKLPELYKLHATKGNKL